MTIRPVNQMIQSLRKVADSAPPARRGIYNDAADTLANLQKSHDEAVHELSNWQLGGGYE